MHDITGALLRPLGMGTLETVTKGTECFAGRRGRVRDSWTDSWGENSKGKRQAANENLNLTSERENGGDKNKVV